MLTAYPEEQTEFTAKHKHKDESYMCDWHCRTSTLYTGTSTCTSMNTSMNTSMSMNDNTSMHSRYMICTTALPHYKKHKHITRNTKQKKIPAQVRAQAQAQAQAQIKSTRHKPAVLLHTSMHLRYMVVMAALPSTSTSAHTGTHNDTSMHLRYMIGTAALPHSFSN